MGYLHTEIDGFQSPRIGGAVCGDVYQFERSSNGTIVAFSDGLGHGIYANLAATMCISRLMTLLKQGCSLRESFGRLVKTMNKNREGDEPYAAFMLLQIRPNGQLTILSYEMPPPIYICRREAQVLQGRSRIVEKAEIRECFSVMEVDDGLLLCSDGVTQAGMGKGRPLGWTPEGVCRYLTRELIETCPIKDFSRNVHFEAQRYWGAQSGDDITAITLSFRAGQVLNLLTGPPSERSLDRRFVLDFIQSEGDKVICGASTAKMAARILGRSLHVKSMTGNMITPPSYHIEGLDLVAEGAVTLNQVYNIIESSLEHPPQTGVGQLHTLLKRADRINIFIGNAPNVDQDNISFQQLGILPRQTIIPLLKVALEKQGKLVDIHTR